jgi:hypothetical protein
MEFFLPSFFLALIAILIIFLVFPRFSPLVLALFAGLVLVAATIHHVQLFGDEYKLMAQQSKLASYAPIILIGTVVLFAIGYIFLFLKRGFRIALPDFQTGIPPPETATNVVTEAIGKGLQAVGLGNASGSSNRSASATATPSISVSANTPSMSLLSLSPSLEAQLDSAKQRNILASRLARQV